jgi:serine/threonine protein kinase
MEEETTRKIRKTRIRKVGPYLLIKPIGKGSYSTVFEGKVEGNNRKVAIKVISLNNVKKKDYERVQMEIKILSLIKHENIV